MRLSFMAVQGVKFNHSNSLLAMEMHHIVQTYYSTMTGRVLWFSIQRQILQAKRYYIITSNSPMDNFQLSCKIGTHVK